MYNNEYVEEYTYETNYLHIYSGHYRRIPPGFKIRYLARCVIGENKFPHNSPIKYWYELYHFDKILGTYGSFREAFDIIERRLWLRSFHGMMIV